MTTKKKERLILGTILIALVVIGSCILEREAAGQSLKKQVEPKDTERKAEARNIMDINFYIITLLVAFSGWGTLIYKWYTSRPKIKGQIFNVMLAKARLVKNSNQMFTVFNVYLYLTNRRKNSIHVLDYELEVDTGTGFERVKRTYGTHEVPGYKFESSTQIIEIPDYIDKLIYAKSKPVEYGIPLHGWVVFASEKSKDQYKDKVKRYKITCIDAFNKRRKIKAFPKKFPSLNFLRDIAGIKITDKEKED